MGLGTGVPTRGASRARRQEVLPGGSGSRAGQVAEGTSPFRLKPRPGGPGPRECRGHGPGRRPSWTHPARTPAPGRPPQPGPGCCLSHGRLGSTLRGRAGDLACPLGATSTWVSGAGQAALGGHLQEGRGASAQARPTASLSAGKSYHLPGTGRPKRGHGQEGRALTAVSAGNATPRLTGLRHRRATRPLGSDVHHPLTTLWSHRWPVPEAPRSAGC